MRFNLVKLIIVAVLASVTFGPMFFSARISRADPPGAPSIETPKTGIYDSKAAQELLDDVKKGGVTGKEKVPGGWVSDWAFSFLPDPQTLILGLVSNTTYWLLFKPAALFMSIGGLVLDQSVALSINSETLRQVVNNNSSAVNMGWKLARDIVNLFLIFILLFIAIAIILQVSKYGAKELLFTLIIVAFMVNFSLVITKIIIDASNVLATGIYDFFPAGTTGSGAQTANISKLLENGLDTRKIIAMKFDNVGTNRDLLLKIIITTTLGAITMAIAGFIFLVFGVLLLIRMVVLMLLMIFAPLAFAAHILPSTKAHASLWWNQLLNQAFFAPAVLFMLWIVVSMVSGPDSFIKTALTATGISQTGEIDPGKMLEHIGAEQPPEDWGNIAFMINFLLIIILLIAALIIAKKMGAVGAQAAVAMGDKARQAIQGYAGRVATRVPARLARGFAESDIGKAVARSVPGGGMLYRGMERAAKWGKLEEVTQRKTESEAKLGTSLAPKQQAAYFQKLGARSQEAMFGKMSDRQKSQMLERGGPAAQQALTFFFNSLESKIGKDAVSEQKAKMINNISNETERLAQFRATDENTQQKMFMAMSDKQRAQFWETGGAAMETIFSDIFSRLESEIGIDAVSEQKAKLGSSISTEAGRFGYLGAADINTQQKMFAAMVDRDRVAVLKTLPADVQKALKDSLSTAERDKFNKAEKEVQRKEEIKNITIDQSGVSTAQFTAAIKLTKPEEMSELHKSVASDPGKIKEIIKVISDNHLRKIEERGDEVSDAVVDAIYALDETGTRNAANIISALRNPAINNPRLARIIETGPVRARLGLR